MTTTLAKKKNTKKNTKQIITTVVSNEHTKQKINCWKKNVAFKKKSDLGTEFDRMYGAGAYCQNESKRYEFAYQMKWNATKNLSPCRILICIIH